MSFDDVAEGECVRRAANIKARWDQERANIDSAHRKRMTVIQEKLMKARKMLVESGVSESMTDILRVMWHWPSWSKRDEKNWKIPEGLEGEITELDGSEGHEPAEGVKQRKWIEWRWQDTLFKIQLDEFPNYTGGGSPIGSLCLWVNEKKVLGLDVSLESKSGAEYNNWVMFGVDSLKVDDWMEKIVDLAGRLRIAEEDWRRRYDEDFYGKKAGNVDF